MNKAGHQHIRVHSNRFRRSHRDQMIQEKLAISILEKHRSLVDPAQDHMHWVADSDECARLRKDNRISKTIAT
jgi:hypothetical protein